MLNSICQSFKLTFVTFAVITIIIPISIGQDEEPNNYVSESWGSSDFKIDRLRYTYIINKFKYCCQNFNDIITSPTFSSNSECIWRLEIFPKGMFLEYEDRMALFLRSVNCLARASVKFSILNSNRTKSFIKDIYQDYSPSEIYGFPDFISHEDLLSSENGLLPDEKLTIICEIAVLSDRENYSGKLSLVKSHLTDDLTFLFDNQDFSDVTLITAGGRTFKAHKAILAARSQVFRAMFVNDTVHRPIFSVKISNLDYKVMTEMLRYIYTDEALELQKLAPKLLAAAEHYKLDGLKARSESTLLANLTIENAVDFLILGDKYHATNLKKDAKHFIVSQLSQIKNNTNSLEKLILSEPRLAVEIIG